MRAVNFTLNGRATTAYAAPRLLLSDFIRRECGATGTHVGCEHGVCGACTVLMDGMAVRSCLIFAQQAEGAEITTIEGLADDPALDDLRAAFKKHHALQCGFCTPGIIVTLAAWLATNPAPDAQALREELSGNLCRCTGYTGIVEAALEVARARHA